MPIATPEIYAQMLDRAKQQGFAYPAINVTSSQTLNAALKGFADAESDGIVQVSTGGAEYLSGQSVKDMVTGASALAEFAHVVADRYPINVALHTDHCPKDKLDGYMRPLVAISAERVKAGKEPLFQSHMWDGSAVPLTENLEIAKDLLAKCAAAKIIMSSRSASSAAKRTALSARSTRSCTPLPRTRSRRRRPWHRRARPVHPRRDLRQRARCVQAGARETPPERAQGHPGHGGRQVWQGQAVRPGLPRRLRLGRERDPRGALVRRREDERGHRHAVRVHPPGRRATCSATTTACSRWTATSATRRRTTRAPGASPPSPA